LTSFITVSLILSNPDNEGGPDYSGNARTIITGGTGPEENLMGIIRRHYFFSKNISFLIFSMLVTGFYSPEL
jgi:hypothetical protein